MGSDEVRRNASITSKREFLANIAPKAKLCAMGSLTLYEQISSSKQVFGNTEDSRSDWSGCSQTQLRYLLKNSPDSSGGLAPALCRVYFVTRNDHTCYEKRTNTGHLQRTFLLIQSDSDSVLLQRLKVKLSPCSLVSAETSGRKCLLVESRCRLIHLTMVHADLTCFP